MWLLLGVSAHNVTMGEQELTTKLCCCTATCGVVVLLLHAVWWQQCWVKRYGGGRLCEDVGGSLFEHAHAEEVTWSLLGLEVWRAAVVVGCCRTGPLGSRIVHTSSKLCTITRLAQRACTRVLLRARLVPYARRVGAASALQRLLGSLPVDAVHGVLGGSHAW